MELTIEKLVYGGDGLARVASGDRAKTIFVPYVLPKERVEARIIEQKPGFAHAQLNAVIESSTLRSAPPCPYFTACGGCHYQHIAYEHQLRFKSEILSETLRRVGKLEVPLEIQTHSSPALNYRNRTRFHVRSDPEFAIGYFRHASRELVPIRECPISSPLINRALEVLWKIGAAKQLPPAIYEMELFANERDDELLTELYVRELRQPSGLQDFARNFAQSLPGVVGIAASYPSEAVRHTAAMPEVLSGQKTLNYRVGEETYRVSAGAFFQTNRHLVGRMVDLAINGRGGRVALDLYSGVGLFTLPLARRFERVVAVECSPVSADDLRSVAPANVKVSSQTTEKYLTCALGKLRPDLIVVDPPRSGLGPVVSREISKLSASEVVYVSCDPATLARDLKQLTSSAFEIAQIHLIDLFPHTFHVETCAILRR
jgi:23S rRNA (uracil1939-C5)-methyltransferase